MNDPISLCEDLVYLCDETLEYADKDNPHVMTLIERFKYLADIYYNKMANQTQEVVVEVNDGVAEVVKKPDFVNVVIVDNDKTEV